MKNKIIWTGTIVDSGGYAAMNRGYVSGLKNRGHNIRIEIMPGPLDIGEEKLKFFKQLAFSPGFNPHNGNYFSKPILEEDATRIIAHLPLSKPPKCRKTIIFTMLETTVANPSFIDRCNNYYQECWTVNEFYRRTFIDSGLKIPCKIAPIGIDEIYNKKNACEMNFNYKIFGNNSNDIFAQPSGFKFLSIFRWSYRKGFDVLIKSFLKEFTKDDNVSLSIFSRHAAMSHDKRFYDAVERDLSAMYEKYANKNSPSIFWCSDVIPIDFMPSVYFSHDVYASTSRGEGHGMSAIEASAMGLPILVPNHTGYTDYVNNDNAYLFEVDEWVKCNDVPEWTGWITREFANQKFPKFGDKTIEEVGCLMRRMKNNEDERKLKNKKMQETVDQKYKWDKCIDTVEKHLKE